jgi:pSer/pThr/pTyr-binding forkhead associated (FHA) protein
MLVRLVIEYGRRRRVFTLKPPGGVLGRGDKCAVRIPSAEVSRKHCRLRLEDGYVYVEDLDSVNGTFLNGKAVEERTLARPGDTLEVGPVSFVVEYEMTPQAVEHLRKEYDYEAVPAPESEQIPTLEPAEDPRVAAAADDPVELDLDFIDQPWEIPQGEDFRDILSQMEDTRTVDEDRKKRRR